MLSMATGVLGTADPWGGAGRSVMKQAVPDQMGTGEITRENVMDSVSGASCLSLVHLNQGAS